MTQTEHKAGGASCPMDFILRMLMGPWTTYVLYNLKTYGPQRFGELKRRVAGVSAKMLTERLRTLEGASTREVAEHLRISPVAVRQRLRRARLSILRELESLRDCATAPSRRGGQRCSEP